MSAGPVIVLGAGGHAKVVESTLRALGENVIGYYDDDSSKWGQPIDGVDVAGPLSEARSAPTSRAVIGIGDNRTRKRIAEDYDLDWVTVIHPFSWVAPGAILGPGTVVFAGSTVQTGAVIGAHVILNSRSSADHHVMVGDYVHVAGAQLAGACIAGEGAFFGIGSAVLPEVTVGAWAIVGAGAIVSRDVRDGAVVVGNPARETISRQPRQEI